ncbi:MAG: beta galactosidase jelly roll domain-containing protein [Gammaproteobacteria bacterium]|nr:beta galactosidase jelly roll domain-containing protein [Gammaproteobacteria bacterium]MBU1654485.1 beta galactosidase jelly roll domain-containing protein [Gammaproteobacteria bacterium]MBU1960137.1 beta galactosidase jelly roll domain-containing protein [Gammaproteobacteria bacterium]
MASAFREYAAPWSWWTALLLGLLCFSPMQQGMASSLDLGGDWRFKPDPSGQADYSSPRTDVSGWDRIRVPSNWYLQKRDISGVAWYQRSFELSDELEDERAWLRFAGVDYHASVWLNGHLLGKHEGYFQPFSFEITKRVKSGPNILTVRVDSPLETGGAEWSLHKRLIKGVFSHHDTRPGGAWSERGQERNSGGIWAPVTLEISGRTLIETAHIRPHVNQTSGLASGRVELTLDQGLGKSREVIVDSSLVPQNFTGPSTRFLKRLVLKPGKNRVLLNIPSRPYRLWTLWERGYPHLYTYRVAVVDAKTRAPLAEASRAFGFRSIAHDKDSGEWRLNGKRLFLRGTNYIPTHWLSEMSPRRYAADLAMMRRANINIVRVHAHIGAASLYDEADKAGILIWQDFPLQWGYQDSEEFIQAAERQVGDMVSLLYNNPSVAVWSLHNEPPWDADWMKFKYKSYDPAQNRELDQRLLKALSLFDDGRHKHMASLTKEHPWLGWYSGTWLDYLHPTDAKLVTEFGAQALPNLDTLKTLFSEKELWPDNEAEWKKWEYHNFQRRETFDLAKVSPGNNIHQFIANSQGYQAKITALAAESYRRQRYQPVGGIFQFMFVEAWPSINWAVVDYLRKPKPGYYALQRAFQPILPSLEWQKDRYAPKEPVRIGIWAINDLGQNYFGARLRYRVSNKQKLISRQEIRFDLKADTGRKLHTLELTDLAPGQYRVEAVIMNRRGVPLGRNEFLFEVGDKPGS